MTGENKADTGSQARAARGARERFGRAAAAIQSGARGSAARASPALPIRPGSTIRARATPHARDLAPSVW
jgi:hypothetical protein